MRAEKPLSPQKLPVSPAREDEYEEDFEKTNENVSSLEEDRRKEGIYIYNMIIELDRHGR